MAIPNTGEGYLGTGISGNDPIRLAKSNTAKMVKEAKDSCRTVREKWLAVAEEGDAMFAGEQWTAKELAYLNDKRRPIFSFNYILRTILGILGLEIGNRQQPLLRSRIPTNPGQNEIAEFSTEIIKWIWDQCEGDENFTMAFFDNLRRGMGWLEGYMDYDEDPEGIFKFKRVNGIQMYWDVAADMPNLSNSFWRMRSLKLPYRQLIVMWGKEVAEEIRAALQLDGDQSFETVHNISPVGYLPGSDVIQHDSPQYGEVMIDQFQWWEWQEMWEGIDPKADPNDPQAKTITVDKASKKLYEKTMAAQGRPNPVMSKFNKKTFKQCWTAGKYEIQTTDLNVPDFTFQCMTGIRDDKNHIFFGIAKPMTDPNRFRNKYMSAAIENFGKSLKHPLLVKEGAVANPRRFEDEITGPGAIAVVNDPSEASIRQLPSSDIPQGLVFLFKASDDAVQNILGLPLELFGGSTNRDEGAALDRQRQQNAISTMSPFFASERTCRLRMAKLTLEYARRYMGDGRLLPLTNNSTKQAVQLFRDELISNYSVVLDDNPRNPSIRMALWNEFQPFLMLAARQGMFGVLDKMFSFAPWPVDIVDEIKQEFQKMQQAMQQGQPATGAQAQRQSPELNQAKAAAHQSTAKLNEAKAAATTAAIRLKAAALGAEMEQFAAENKLKREQAVAKERESHRKHLNESVRDHHKASAEYGHMLAALKTAGDTKTGD